MPFRHFRSAFGNCQVVLSAKQRLQASDLFPDDYRDSLQNRGCAPGIGETGRHLRHCLMKQFAQTGSRFQDHCRTNPQIVGHRMQLFGSDLIRVRDTSQTHCQVPRNVFAISRAYQIVKRSKLQTSSIHIQQRQIFTVRIRVPHNQIEQCPVHQLLKFDQRKGRVIADDFCALPQSRSAFFSYFLPGLCSRSGIFVTFRPPMTENVPIGNKMSDWLVRHAVFPARDFLSPQGEPVGPFCRNGHSPQGELPWGAHPLHGDMLLFFPARMVAGRGEPRSTARQAVPTVGPFCRNGLSPQGETPWDARSLHVAMLLFFPARSVAGRGGAARSIPAEWTYFDERDQPPYFHSRNAVTSPPGTGLFWMYFTMRSSCSSLRDQ